MHEVCAERAAGGARGGIFDDSPGNHAARVGASAAAEREAIGHGAVRRNQVRERAHVHLDFREHGAAVQRNHQIGNSGGDEFDRQRGREIAGLQTERRGERGARECGAREARGLLRHGDAHGAAIVKSEFDGKNSGAGLLQDVHAAFGRGDDAEFGEQKPGADHGMSGEREFARGGENAQASERAIIRGPLDEDRFG